MGWASGGELAEDIWDLISQHLPVKQKKRIATEIIALLEQRDCDTIYECVELIKAAGWIECANCGVFNPSKDCDYCAEFESDM